MTFVPHRVHPVGHSYDTSPPLLMTSLATILKPEINLWNVAMCLPRLIWALGCLAFTLCQGDPPVHGRDPQRWTYCAGLELLTSSSAFFKPFTVVRSS